MGASSQAAPINQLRKEPFFRKTLATMGLVALLAIPAFFLVVLQRSTKSSMLRTGDFIPVAGSDSVGSGAEIIAGMRGRRTAIMFFSVDCPHCQNEIPILNEAERKFGSETDFVAIALNDKLKIDSFVRTHDIRMRVISDDKGVAGKMFGVSEVPAIFLLSENQKIEWVGVGEQPRGELFRRLSALGAKPTSTTGESPEEIRK